MTKEEIASTLKKLRQAAGMKRQAVADAMGVSVKTIGHWETGYAQPDADKLFSLCDLYGTTVDDAFLFKHEMGGRIVANAIMSNRDRSSLDKYFELTDADKEMVIGMIDRLHAGQSPTEP